MFTFDSPEEEHEFWVNEARDMGEPEEDEDDEPEEN